MRRLTDDEAQILAQLHRQITKHHVRNKLRTNYVEAERWLERGGYRLPDGAQVDQVPLYWPAKAIEVFASRLIPASFSLEESQALLDDLEQVYADAGVHMTEQMAIKSSLRHGPAFMFVSDGDSSLGEPEVVVTAQSALRASCLMDRTRRVSAALEVLDDGMLLHLPGRVLKVTRGAKPAVVEEYPAPERVRCVPYIHDADLEKPFGTSRVSRPVMGFTDAAMRTFMRQEVSAEWYQNPRERILGVDPSAFDDDAPGWAREPGAIEALPDVHPDDDPTLPDNLRRAEWHVFPQMSMQPFSDQFRLIAAQFSGASSIPLSYLGIVQDSNPTSAEAIEAQDVDLVRAVKAQFPSYSWSRRQTALHVLRSVHGDFDESAVRSLTARWEDPRHRGVQEQGQFVAQQVAAGNLVAGSPTTLGLLPISPAEARAAALEVKQAAGAGVLAALLDRAEQVPMGAVTDANTDRG